ncbi:hypothetical protein [Brevundimonas naejangsanensis]|uniref:hypothetical protein n=1 Tax=Brevundimonas naejangsanensis TaxID=588932 RepID=UPI001ABCCF42|nr:hypothetical protein [Brevundimonas naejangsanensis]
MDSKHGLLVGRFASDRRKARVAARASLQTGWRFGLVCTGALIVLFGPQVNSASHIFGTKGAPIYMVAANCNTPSYRLTFADAVDIWLRLWSGEFQNRIAASYDVNPARVSEVVKRRKHVGSEAVAQLIARRDAA